VRLTKISALEVRPAEESTRKAYAAEEGALEVRVQKNRVFKVGAGRQRFNARAIASSVLAVVLCAYCGYMGITRRRSQPASRSSFSPALIEGFP